MDILYDLLVVLHVVSFVFMSVPLFNLIVVSERAKFGAGINYPVDRYMENILAGGAPRCFVFQATVGVTGVLLLILGPLGIAGLWTNWVITLKTLLLATLISLLANVHTSIQPKIETLISGLSPDTPAPDEVLNDLKPLRMRRKKLAAVCLFLVLTIILLGLQVYTLYSPFLTLPLLVAIALFSRRAYTKGVPTGWI